ERSDERLDSTKRFIASIETLASDNPLALVGVLYVNEGATNGNKIVAMRIRESLGLDHSIPLGYLDPHGAEQRKRWMAFRGQLDALEMSDAEKRQCVDAARATFQLFMDLSAELSSGPAASAS
ncbi:MAG: biliverdin-producing heme oxygenase, partial [Planctomycetota bacterium]